ncbi:MAG: hypothetical protein J7M26_10150 [Armatimonadetes bacterium]|nr:hypothetical protein [Armatimonadota bacterium]
MAQTENYELDILTDEDFVNEGWFQRLVKVLDRALGEFLQQWACGGVISGWSLGTDKTVSAGEGIVNGCHCKTASSTDISSILTSGTTNYVYAVTTANSAPDGDVAFQATQVATNIPSTAVRLGKLVLDASGNVTGADDDPSDCPRDYAKPLRYRRIAGEWTGQVAVGEALVIEIDHSDLLDFAVPLDLTVETDPGVHVVALADGASGSVFRLRIWNEWQTGYAYGYGGVEDIRVTWRRGGFA